jgi:hypothetical protein
MAVRRTMGNAEKAVVRFNNGQILKGHENLNKPRLLKNSRGYFL